MLFRSSPSSVVWVSVPVAVGVSVVEPWLELVGAWVESVAGDGYFGASGMGEATPIIFIVIAVVIADRHVAPMSPISLFFGGCLF